jgi:ATP synthase protein I
MPTTSTPDETRRHHLKDARSASPGLMWPGLTTAQSLAVASQFGVSLAVGVALGLVAGQWLDGQMHTGYVFTLIGVFAGLILGSSGIVALYRATLRSSEREWHDESGAESKKTRPLPASRQHT